MSVDKITVTRSFGQENFSEIFLELLERKLENFKRNMEEKEVINYNNVICTTQSSEVIQKKGD